MNNKQEIVSSSSEREAAGNTAKTLTKLSPLGDYPVVPANSDYVTAIMAIPLPGGEK